MSVDSSYFLGSLRALAERLDLVAASIISQLLPVVAALAVGVIAAIAVVAAALASPAALAPLIIAALILVVAVALVAAAVGVGGLAIAVLDAARGVKRGLLEPFKDAWSRKWAFLKLLVAVTLVEALLLALAAAPLLPQVVALVEKAPLEAGGPAFISRLYSLLTPAVAVAAALRLVFDPSYVFAAAGGGVWESLRRGAGAALEVASSDPLGFAAFFLLFLFPDVLVFLYADAFLLNPALSNAFSLAVWAKNIAVEPLYLLAAAMAGTRLRLLGPFQGGRLGEASANPQ